MIREGPLFKWPWVAWNIFWHAKKVWPPLGSIKKSLTSLKDRLKKVWSFQIDVSCIFKNTFMCSLLWEVHAYAHFIRLRVVYKVPQLLYIISKYLFKACKEHPVLRTINMCSASTHSIKIDSPHGSIKISLTTFFFREKVWPPFLCPTPPAT